MLEERCILAFDILKSLWPEAKPLLSYSNCFELLIAVMLSAQCTDEQVNKVTPELFKRWPDSAALASAELTNIEEVIHSVGFFRTKALHIKETAGMLHRENAGELPRSIEALTELPGVGRKTANLVASSCFGLPGIIVDTHVLRVSMRFGIHDKPDPAKIESAIARIMKPEQYTHFSHALNRHGKFHCTARKPSCSTCPIERICPKIGL